MVDEVGAGRRGMTAACLRAPGENVEVEAESRPRGTRVLVVDDNDGTLTATVKYLEMTGFEVCGAATGAAALDAAEGWVPEAVVLDLGLPDIDGFAVLARLKDDAGSRPVTFIAVSGRDDDATRERARESGFDAYLVKPVSLDAIVSRLREALT